MCDNGCSRFSWRWPCGRGIDVAAIASVCGLGWLEFDAGLLAIWLLAVVSLVASVRVLVLSRVRWGGLLILVVVVVRLRVVVVLSGSPARAVEGHPTGLAATTSGYASGRMLAHRKCFRVR